MNKELEVIKPGTYALATQDIEEVKALIAERYPDGMAFNDMPRVRIPAGGGLFWSLTNDDGEEVAEKKFVGVIVAHKPFRSYFLKQEEGEEAVDRRPICTSVDGRIGTGMPLPGDEVPVQRSCHGCPLSKWDGHTPPPCKLRRAVLVLRPNMRVPTLFIVPVTSLKAFLAYTDRPLLNVKLPPLHAVVTSFTLDPATSRGGDKYSLIQCASVGPLPEKEVAVMGRVSAMLKEQLTAILESVAAQRDTESDTVTDNSAV